MTRAEHRGHDAEPTRTSPTDVGARANGAVEDRPVDARDREQAELDHHAREEHAHRRRRDGVRVGEPEVERHDRRLDQEADEEQRQRDDHEPPAAAPRERAADLGEVERAGARVEERDPEQER